MIKFLVGQITDCYQKVQQEFFSNLGRGYLQLQKLTSAISVSGRSVEVATGFCKVNSSIAVKTQVSGGPPLYPLQHLPPCTLTNLPAFGPAEIYILRIGGNIGAVIIEIGRPQMKLHLLVWSHIFGY